MLIHLNQVRNMKVDRHDQAAILSDEQFQELLSDCSPRYKLLFAITYYASARIGEVIKLQASDIRGGYITFKKQNTKTKDTRQVKISIKLQAIIDEVGLEKGGYLFPNNTGKSCISRQAVDKYLRLKCDYLGFEGVSTHSFRRTSITKMFKSGIPLKLIGEHSGHKDLDNLVKYIEIDNDAKDAAVEVL